LLRLESYHVSASYLSYSQTNRHSWLQLPDVF
jgi:hypothetical protein